MSAATVVSRGRKSRRAPALSAFALFVGAGAVASWLGCSADDKNETYGLNADPGGTFGAEVVVKVKGRGRVTANIPGLECPSSCFARYVYKDKASAGTVAGVALKAEATPGSTFTGFTFETIPLPTSGRGSEDCNPLTRTAVSPPGAGSGTEVVLPFGETEGTPPEGKSCGSRTVPVAYAVTANFTTPPEPPEAGPPDGGVDAGQPGELVFNPPTGGAIGREIGIVGGRLYWRYEVGGQSGIATGFAGGSVTPTTLVSTSPGVQRFDVGTSHVVYQQVGGALAVIANGGTTSTTLPGAPLNCENLASDTTNAYCLTPGGLLYAWTTAGTGPTILHSGLPVGNDKFAVDSNAFYFVDDPTGTPTTASIKSAPKTGTFDAGMPTLTTLVSGQSNPIRLSVNTSRLVWINYDTNTIDGVLQSASRFGGSATTAITTTNNLRALAVDQTTSSTVFGGVFTTGTILRASTSGGTPIPLVSGINGLGGIAVDGSFIYWTSGDGSVWRQSKF